jgi:hypothetical protein
MVPAFEGPAEGRLGAGGTWVVPASVLDAAGNPVPAADNSVVFGVTGNGKLLGLGSGDPADHHADRSAGFVRGRPQRSSWPGPEKAAWFLPPSPPALPVRYWKPGYHNAMGGYCPV